MIYESNELYHHGVKGMKWGVRKAAKYQSQADKLRNKNMNRRRPSKKLEKKIAKLEKQAAELKTTKGTIKHGAKAAAKALALIGGTTLVVTKAKKAGIELADVSNEIIDAGATVVGVCGGLAIGTKMAAEVAGEFLLSLL